MPDLLLEIFSDEIPARMQPLSEVALSQKTKEFLHNNGVSFENITVFSTPTRLVLLIKGLPLLQKKIVEVKRGTRVDAPLRAHEGFLKSVGLASLEECTVENGYYMAHLSKGGAPIQKVLTSTIPSIINSLVFCFSRTMRWGASSLNDGAPRWARPVKNILCIFEQDGGNSECVKFNCLGLTSNAKTFVRGEDYNLIELETDATVAKYFDFLKIHSVTLSRNTRKETIKNEIAKLLKEKNLEIYEDEALLEEVVGLVDNPTVYLGEFDTFFLTLPIEVIQTTIRNNQKSFITRDKETKK